MYSRRINDSVRLNQNSLNYIYLSKLANLVSLFPAQTDGTTPLLFVLTLWHHFHDDSHAGFSWNLVVGILEGAAEYALVGSCVIEGHFVDEDRAILQVLAALGAVPVQALIETWVFDREFFIFIFIVV